MIEIPTDFDTIVAVSTPLGEGAIGIIRLSGSKSLNIVNNIFKIKRRNNKESTSLPLCRLKSHTIHYGHIFDSDSGQVVDEVMISIMKKPKSFTKEDIVEINCHGGIIVINQVLKLLLNQGVRLAEPGEFTKRAFLNGRIDLSQAEALADLIRAKTDQVISCAIKQLDGDFSKMIRKLRQKILKILAQVEVSIDYPEYDGIEEIKMKKLLQKIMSIKSEIKKVLATAEEGKILREGLKTVIIGRPNVGKSSLLNYLLKEEKAIVTNIAGTTRDIIEEYVNIQGVPLNLVDTAGIRETKDIVEKIGIERTHKVLLKSDLVLLILDQSVGLTHDDKKLLELTKRMKRIILWNKTDLSNNENKNEICNLNIDSPQVMISILKKIGLEDLKKQIVELFFSKETQDKNMPYILNARHIQLLNKALQCLDEAVIGVGSKIPVDLIQIDITECWEYLGEIIGENVQDELITKLFSEFCLGK